jgi:atypical dual specificity phosphatase
MNIAYPNLWWLIDGVLAGMGMPYIAADRRMNFGGPLDAYPDDLPLMHQAGVRAVVCLLNIPSDAPVFETAGFEFRCWPIPDGQPPTLEQAEDFVGFVKDCAARKVPVAAFCEAGLGRTGTMLASYLVMEGKGAREAIAQVRSRQPSAVETQRQILFVEQFEQLHRNHPGGDPIP